MVIDPKHKIDDSGPKKRPFVGREPEIKIFLDAVNDKFGATTGDKPSAKAIAFYGMGGIGKSELRNKLSAVLKFEKPGSIQTSLDFYNPTYRLTGTALFQIRAKLKAKYSISFPSFDVAYAIYWRKANPQMPLNKDTFLLWDESGLAADLISTAKEIPIVGLAPKILQAIEKGYKALKGAWTKRILPQLQNLTAMEAEDIAERLSMFLAEDIRRFNQSRSLPIVLFFDTYEMLLDQPHGPGSQIVPDVWVQELVGQLPEALFVITGRKNLEWAERDDAWSDHLDQYELGKLPEDKSIEYLVGCKIEDKDIQKVILKSSEGWPIYLAASAETFDKIKKNENRDPIPDDFGRTYREIFERLIRNLDKIETDTLNVISAARRWDGELFKLLVDEFDTGLRKIDFDRFHDFSFIIPDPDSGTWKLHELMRDHVQDFQDKKLRHDVHAFLFKFYNSQLTDIDIKSITDQHKTALTEAFYHASRSKTVEDLCNWMLHAVIPFNDAAQWDILIPLYLQAIDYLEDDGMDEGSLHSTCLNNLGSLYHDQGKYTKAEPLYKRALKIDEKAFGLDHPFVTSDMNNLAMLYYDQGKYTEAEPLYKRALKVDEKAFGLGHPTVATDLNNLGELYRAQGKYVKAEPMYIRALEINEKSLRKDHPEIAKNLTNLASSYYDQGKYSEAEPLYKRALNIFEKSFGENHPNVAVSLNNLALLYKTQRKYAEAEPLYLRTLQIWKEKLGEQHPNTITVLINIAILYHEWGKKEQAQKYALLAEAAKKKS